MVVTHVVCFLSLDWPEFRLIYYHRDYLYSKRNFETLLSARQAAAGF